MKNILNKISTKFELKREIENLKCKNLELNRKIDALEMMIKTNKIECDYMSFAATDEKSTEVMLRKWYYKNTGKSLDLNNPKSFNEKIQWLKLHDSTPMKTRLADKYLVRDFVAKKIGKEHLVGLVGVFDDIKEVDFKKLPKKFALKANHGSGYNYIVKDKNRVNWLEVCNIANGWMAENFAYRNGFEMHYKDIVPKIIIEEFCQCECEYQFWCFNGELEFVSVINEPHGVNKKTTFDMDWNKLEFVTSLPRMEDDVLRKPEYFEDLKKMAKKLCEGFIFARVDFMYDGKNILFSEITFTPASGLCGWEPEEWDLVLGEKLKINN